MDTKPKVTPKDFFMWAGAMAALYVSIGSFVALMFEYIDRLAGDAAVLGYDPYSGGIQFAIASLVVIFPVYIALTRMLNQDIRRNPEKKELWVRRWLVFLAVFVAGIAMLIDLIVLINTFLGGEELTAAFLLKVLTVLLVAGGVFYYYLSDIQGKWDENEKMSKMIGAVVAVLVLISIVSGFFIMGSPYTQRKLGYDNTRISDLQNIQYQITDYYRNKQALPESLSDLQDPLQGNYIPNDPETNEPYEYNSLGDLTFELCATFGLPLPQVDPASVSAVDWRARELEQYAQNWPHDAGRTCFERTVDPDKYPPLSEVKPLPVR
ncbi:MAG: DUF5671 domain-containing protein [bacterium]|nr:DUF5671 domain-containing protein [bacterium]